MLEHLPYLLGMILGEAIPILISLWIFFLIEKQNWKKMTRKPLPGKLIFGAALFGFTGMIPGAIIYLIRRRIYNWRQFDRSTATALTPTATLDLFVEPKISQSQTDSSEAIQ